MGGGKSKPSNPGSSPYEAELARQSQDVFSSTSPLRQQLITDMGGFVNGGYNPRSFPAYQGIYNSARTGTEGQYKVAKENILGSTARGGGQTQALTGLERDRANQVGNLESMISKDLITDLMNKSYGSAFGAPQQSIGGLGSASSSYAARQAAMAQTQGTQKGGFYGMMGGLGQGLGSYMGGK
jgi:hypothetical protein